MSLSTPNRLADFLEPFTYDEARVILKKFYEGVYKMTDYHPDNSVTVYRQILDQFKPQNMLEVGCGPGLGVRYALDAGVDAHGCDIADLPDVWAQNGLNGRCRQGAAQNLPYSDDSFEMVLCSDVLEHILACDIPIVLSEIRRVMQRVCVIGICLVEERHPVADKIYSHITLMPGEWWREQVKAAGLVESVMFQDDDDYLSLGCTKYGTIREV